MAKRSPTEPACCPPKPDIRQRPLITPQQAADMMNVFKVLANDTRRRLLHALTCANELAAAVAMRPQAVCNQLQRVRSQAEKKAVAQGRECSCRCC